MYIEGEYTSEYQEQIQNTQGQGLLASNVSLIHIKQSLPQLRKMLLAHFPIAAYDMD